MDDGALVRAIGKGDDLALRELFDRHAPWVAARLRRVLPPDAVEDVVQETFVAVWKGAKSFRGQGGAGAWVWGIARRQAATSFRKRGLPTQEEMLDTAGPDDPATEAAVKLDLERALATLGPDGNDDRELARLLWEEGRPVAEVASRLGIPEGTVKSRAFRIRRRLRAVLEGGNP